MNVVAGREVGRLFVQLQEVAVDVVARPGAEHLVQNSSELFQLVGVVWEPKMCPSAHREQDTYRDHIKNDNYWII